MGGYSFDFVHGELTCTKLSSPQKSVVNFITQTSISPEIFQIANPTIFSLEESQEILDALYQDYRYYYTLENRIQANKNHPDVNTWLLEQQEVSDRMKYPNPYIWLCYKLEAYKNSPQEIRTIGDLKEHCKSPTYICHKRLHFLTDILKTYHIDIWNEKYDQYDV